jgi:hypothetical protein
MSHRHDSSLITSAHLFGGGGLGVLAENIPSTGENGGSYLYNDLSLPADNGKEICGRITSWPSDGNLFAYEDGSFEFTIAPDGSYTFIYQLYVDGVATGSPTTVSLFIGTTNTLLVVSDASHLSISDNLLLEASGATNLVMQDAAHIHTVDNISLNSEELLIIGGALHAHASDALVLSLPSPPGTCPTVDEIRLAVWQHVIEAGISAEQIVRIVASSLAGTSEKVGSTITFKGIDGVTDRIVGSFDAENNRTGSIVDGS